MNDPGRAVVKTLFAVSCNVCAYPGCEERLTHPSWKRVNADIAHIAGERPGAPRYDADMTDAERQAYENLVLLCPNHHRLVDWLDPDGHPVARLRDIKAQHEARCGAAQWATDDQYEHFAALLLAAGAQERPAPPGRPQLVLRRVGKEGIEIENVGTADAYEPSVTPVDDATAEAFVRGPEGAPRLSPGGVWTPGAYAATFGNAGPHAVVVKWSDEGGTPYEAHFPL